MNKLEIARIVGECTLGAGVCAGAGCAATYSKKADSYIKEIVQIKGEWTDNVKNLEFEYQGFKGCVSNPEPALMIVNPDCQKRREKLDTLFREDIPKLKNHPFINNAE